MQNAKLFLHSAFCILHSRRRPMFEYVIFFFFAAVAVIFSLVVVLHRNQVVSALSLGVSFFSLVAIFESYVFPFEMVSILLLAAIVGALLLSGRGVKKAEVGP